MTLFDVAEVVHVDADGHLVEMQDVEGLVDGVHPLDDAAIVVDHEVGGEAAQAEKSEASMGVVGGVVVNDGHLDDVPHSLSSLRPVQGFPVVQSAAEVVTQPARLIPGRALARRQGSDSATGVTLRVHVPVFRVVFEVEDGDVTTERKRPAPDDDGVGEDAHWRSSALSPPSINSYGRLVARKRAPLEPSSQPPEPLPSPRAPQLTTPSADPARCRSPESLQSLCASWSRRSRTARAASRHPSRS